MCGLTGLWKAGAAGQARHAEAMLDCLVHRGPDDSGLWLDDEAGIALGFRRLSINDLSPAGHQPMASADGRVVLVFNGEIYNFPDLAREVEAARPGLRWRGHSDTEILVEAIALWGLEGALARANGMFALAAWDRAARTLSLARDRMGKKPMYFGWLGGSFVFASELKAIRAHPDFDLPICPEALSAFLQVGYVPGARCIFAGLAKLRPGHVLRLDAADAAARRTPASRAWWDLRAVAHAGLDAQASGRVASQEAFEALLEDSVRLRMVADVPVGTFLSGGIDSSLVTALMAQAPGGPVLSFGIGFDDPAWDEAPYARAIAAHLGTEHHEMYVGPAELLGVVARMATICDEPLADDSIIPTTLVSRLAREQVTVALSGDGGDELFGGYERYAAVERWLARTARLPGAGGRLAAPLAARLADAAERLGQQRLGRRLRLLGSLLGTGDVDAVHRMVTSQTLAPDALLATPLGAPHPLEDPAVLLGRSTPVDRMGFMDLAAYLTDDILAKVDRASMSTSLEVRCPLLDYRVVEMSWRFPPEAKYANGVGKLPLRRLLERHVPRRLTDRPKQGFGAPVERWLRHELRDWAEALMSPAALARHGLLDVDACRKLWTDFAERGHGFNRVIWNILVFQAWHATLATPPRAISWTGAPLRARADALPAAARSAPM